MPSLRAVHMDRPHTINRGDSMEQKYAATYYSGKVVINIVAPPPMSEEKIQKILAEFYKYAWTAWNDLSVEERLRINAQCTKAE